MILSKFIYIIVPSIQEVMNKLVISIKENVLRVKLRVEITLVVILVGY